MNAEELLKSWCERLVKLQVRGYGAPHDGGFLCPACSAIHGRADNAFYPFMFLFGRTGDAAWLDAARAVFRWHSRVMLPNGAAYNDVNNLWTGTTTFSTIGYAKALIHCGEAMDADLRKQVEERLRVQAAWIFENLRVPAKIRTNINYAAAAGCVFALAGKILGNEQYLAEARRSFGYCLAHATDNGLIAGEGGSHDAASKRGCRYIDIGYNLEETIPCLAELAHALGDKSFLRRISAVLRVHLDFMLPDGAIDNSNGTRNIKWTYYGSRTSDGCIGALTLLRDQDPVFREAARRHFALLAACSHDGMLYGGRRYRKIGLPPCTHHSLCHAVALADAIQYGFDSPDMDSRPLDLPCETPAIHCRAYPEFGALKIAAGPFQATITSSDASSQAFRDGLSHPSGGTLALLHHHDLGAVIAGSTYAYALSEPLNMQPPIGPLPHATLLPRLEFTLAGRRYASCLETDVTVESAVAEHCVTVNVRADKFDISYTFGERTVGIDVAVHAGADARDPVFILPIVSGTCAVETRNASSTRDIYWIPGGFKAVEYTLRPNANGRFSATLRPPSA